MQVKPSEMPPHSRPDGRHPQTNTQHVRGRMWRKGSLSAQLVGMQTGAATVENCVEIPQKIENGTPICPRNSSSGYLSEEIQNTNSKRYMHQYVQCSIIYNGEDMEAT